MIIKQKQKNVIKISSLFFKFYFYITSILAFCFITLFFNTGLWTNIKEPLLDRFYSSSINNYLNIFDIQLNRLKETLLKFQILILILVLTILLKLKRIEKVLIKLVVQVVDLLTNLKM